MTAGHGAGAGELALWGGVECTVNRVGHVYRDQTRMTGHHDRIDDLARFAALGIQKLRYPVLWERIAPDAPGEYDWRWTDARLAEIARLKMTPIVGLIHHGSGPHYTNLLDPAFPTLFADFAAAAAARYPHVLDWTPVNEPLTTARFSALYGHWYPHAHDERSFLLALFNQIDATRLGMHAIRAVVPGARLIQTEDLGQTYAGHDLSDVADHYNARRWLTWDLLDGRVRPGHAMWGRIADAGLADRAQAIADDPCPADVIGINHYVTSDRYLDRCQARGDLPDGGFHDIEAARAPNPPGPGLSMLLTQAWSRYGTPLAMTECHLGCTREEQMRWLAECWQSCRNVRSAGIDIVALTAWALVGGVDWDSLITRDAGRYESGAFDVHRDTVRPTALAGLLAHMRTRTAHVVLGRPGWWHGASAPHGSAGRPILIAGATGTLGRAFAGACALRGLDCVATDRAEMSIDDPAAVEAALDRHRPWAVVNAAGWVRIDAAETDAAACHRANTHGAITLSASCAERGIPCLSFSSDQVFDGSNMHAHAEDYEPAPRNVYGASKHAAELGCASHADALVVRTAAFFSPYEPHNFVMQVEQALRTGQPFEASDAHIVTPTYVPDLVNTCLDLLIDEERGMWHLSNHEAMTWLTLAQRTAAAFSLDASLLRPESPLAGRAPRPRNAALSSMRGRMLPPFADALARHVAIRGS